MEVDKGVYLDKNMWVWFLFVNSEVRKNWLVFGFCMSGVKFMCKKVKRVEVL